MPTFDCAALEKPATTLPPSLIEDIQAKSAPPSQKPSRLSEKQLDAIAREAAGSRKSLDAGSRMSLDSAARPDGKASIS